MHFLKTSCCAIADINGLSSHYTARDAMVSFCQQALLAPPKFGNFTGTRDQIFSFYLFTAAVGADHDPYAKRFYSLIKENNLGDVYESPTRPEQSVAP